MKRYEGVVTFGELEMRLYSDKDIKEGMFRFILTDDENAIPIPRGTLIKWMKAADDAQETIISEWNHGNPDLASMIDTIKDLLSEED
jgi:hypothetical protein